MPRWVGSLVVHILINRLQTAIHFHHCVIINKHINKQLLHNRSDCSSVCHHS